VRTRDLLAGSSHQRGDLLAGSSHWRLVCPLSDLDDRKPYGTEVDGVPIVLVKVGRTWHGSSTAPAVPATPRRTHAEILVWLELSNVAP